MRWRMTRVNPIIMTVVRIRTMRAVKMRLVATRVALMSISKIRPMTNNVSCQQIARADLVQDRELAIDSNSDDWL
jgi:hypothetical protein